MLTRNCVWLVFCLAMTATTINIAKLASQKLDGMDDYLYGVVGSRNLSVSLLRLGVHYVPENGRNANANADLSLSLIHLGMNVPNKRRVEKAEASINIAQERIAEQAAPQKSEPNTEAARPARNARAKEQASLPITAPTTLRRPPQSTSSPTTANHHHHHPSTEDYVGCFLDSPRGGGRGRDRAMDHHFVGPKFRFGIDQCRTHCRSLNYSYAALQNFDQCACGSGNNSSNDHGYSRHGRTSEIECNTPCRIGPGQCGGVGRNSVWRTTGFFLPAQQKSTLVHEKGTEDTPVVVAAAAAGMDAASVKQDKNGFTKRNNHGAQQTLTNNIEEASSSEGTHSTKDAPTPARGDKKNVSSLKGDEGKHATTIPVASAAMAKLVPEPHTTRSSQGAFSPENRATAPSVESDNIAPAQQSLRSKKMALEQARSQGADAVRAVRKNWFQSAPPVHPQQVHNNKASPTTKPTIHHPRDNHEGMGFIGTEVRHINHNITNATKDLYLPLTAPNLWDEAELLPDWLKEYFSWHQQQVALLNQSNWRDNFHFLIPVARKGHKSGGMTDRIRPLPAMLRLAARSKRILMIHWGRPFALEEFLLPPQGGLDWRIPDYMLQEVLAVGPRTEWPSMERAAATNESVVTIKYQSWNYGELWYRGNTRKGESSVYQTFRDIWRIVFTPAPQVAHRIQANFEGMHLSPGEFATAHIRALYARKDRRPEEIEKIAHNAMNCVSNLRPGGPFFVASDSLLAVQYAVEYGRAHNVKVVTANHPQQPLHLDFHNESDTSVTPADFYDGFVDLYLMGATRCAAVGPGGFARWGHLLGYNDTCVIHHHGRKSRDCDWMDARGKGEAVIRGYRSEEERIQLQLEASHGIPKYHAPML